MLYTLKKDTKITHKLINEHISDYGIICYYIGNQFKIGGVMTSPLREDNNASFGIIEDKATKALICHDFATGDSWNAITFVKEYLKLNTNKAALERIYKDLVLNKGEIPENFIKSVKSPKKTLKKDISVKRQPFNDTDKEYWKQYGIDEKILKLYEVNAIKYLIIDDNIYWEYDKKNPMYVYKVYDKLKIYRPFSSGVNKWRGSLTKNYVFGYKQLPEKDDLLIITKSLKDVMLLHSLGYNAISPSSETTLLPIKAIEEITKRFEKIVVLYDNDEAGRKASDKIKDKYDFNKIEIPELYDEKDITDFYVRYGKAKTIELIKKLLDETQEESI